MTDNFANLIGAAVAAKMTPEFIEKEVDARVEKLVIEVIDRSLRAYSDTAKMIEEALQAALKVNDLNIPSYGAAVTAMLKKQIEVTVSPIIAGRLASDMEEMLNLAPKEIKLSKIAEDMIANIDDGDRYGKVITVLTDASDRGEANWIYLDEDKALSWSNRYQANHRILLQKDGTIFSGWVDQRKIDDGKHFGRGHGLGQKILSWYACGTKIICDEDEVVTSRGDY